MLSRKCTVRLLVGLLLLCYLSYGVVASNESCIGQPFGWKYQDRTDCHGYFVCYMDRAYQAYCDYAEKFDAITKKCVPGKCPPCNCDAVSTIEPTPTTTPSLTPEPTPTVVPTPEPSPEPTPTPEQNPSPEPSPVPSPTPTQEPPTPAPTPEQTPSPEPSPEPSPTPTQAPSTPAPTPEQTPSPEPSPEPSPTPTQEPPTPAPTPEQTPSPEPSPEPSPTPTQAPPTPAPTPSSAPTPGPTPTQTPAPIPTVTIPDGQVDPNIKECNNLPNGSFVRNPEHCRIYYVCRSGKAVKHRCALNQWFDDTHFVCNVRQKVNCPSGKD